MAYESNQTGGREVDPWRFAGSFLKSILSRSIPGCAEPPRNSLESVHEAASRIKSGSAFDGRDLDEE